MTGERDNLPNNWLNDACLALILVIIAGTFAVDFIADQGTNPVAMAIAGAVVGALFIWLTVRWRNRQPDGR